VTPYDAELVAAKGIGSVKSFVKRLNISLFQPLTVIYNFTGVEVMKEEVKYFLTKLICWILLLQLVNISIEPPEIQTPPKTTRATAPAKEINKIESIYEMVSEGLLDIELPDGEDEDIEKTNKSIQLFFSSAVLHAFPLTVPFPAYQAYQPERYSLPFTDPVSPPPKFFS
jgi:hypothetical protein